MVVEQKDIFYGEKNEATSGQDGGIGKYSTHILSQLHQNYKTIIIQNHLKSSWTEVLQLWIERRSHIKTGKRGRDKEQACPIPMCGR